ncbi:MAG TPA: ribosome silencing factor [Desulfobacterales bacterium]|jgi:ribosome-associated protein|nr:ribosome silencing factor [Desulfobacterales bacterium]
MTAPKDSQIDLFVKVILARKAIGVVVLDVHDLTSLADYFIICSGKSNRQVSAIADHVQRELKIAGIRPLSVEGAREGHWVLLDYGYVVIHVFYEPVRHFYDLEGLWADAPRVEIERLAGNPAPSEAREVRHD